MIELINIKKDYIVGKKTTNALKDISFVLPDKGMVFITGKSGSGKSTLMNILGGLDDATSGSFLIDGLNITNIKERKLDEYRNNYVGIIYQNFNLFPNESVIENIRTSTYISDNRISEEDIDEMLDKVDLTDKKYVLTKNLSGGQRQRVAIARALIKKPKLILADEPTGNLDSKTSKTIFNLLKELSKDRLVVIISHDNTSALEYADRIIKLKDGEVISDKIRNKDIKDENTILISSSTISDEKLEVLNKSLKENNVTLVKDDKTFIDYKEKIDIKNEKPNLKRKFRFNKSVFNLSNKFFKTGFFSFIFTCLILVFLISILSFSQSFINFDGTGTMQQVSSDYNSKNYVLMKSYNEYGITSKADKENIYRVEDQDLETIKESGYNGNIYPIYSTYIPNKATYNLEQFKTISEKEMYLDIYSGIALGTVVCNEDYLNKMFGEYGENNKVKILAGSLNDVKDNTKLVVTDYFADSLIEINKAYAKNKYESDDSNDPYQKVVNINFTNRYTIGAVIFTNYKQRYQEILEIRDTIMANPQNASKLAKVLYNLEEYTRFLSEANSLLNLTYSINPNFYSDYTSSLIFSRFENSIIYNASGNKLNLQSDNLYFSYIRRSLNRNEIVLNSDYSSLLTDSEIEQVNNNEDVYIYLDMYKLTDDTTSDKPSIQKQFKIVSIEDLSDGCIGYFSKDDLKEFNEFSIIRYGIVLDDISNLYSISKLAQSNFLYTSISIYTPIFDVFNTIEVFDTLFLLIAVIIIIIIFLTIMSYNLRVVKKNQYRIGVYRGLGYSSSTISLSSFLNLIYLMICLSILSYITCKYTGYLVNKIIVNSFAYYIDNDIIKNYQIIEFSFSSLSLYLGVIFIVSLISMLSPIAYIKNLKPNIILNKVD